MVTDSHGNVISRHDYLPFGEELPGNTAGRGSVWGAAGDTVSQRFTGKERDQESGLDYFGARYYGSALGRFTSPDPKIFSGQRISDPQQWNSYVYTRNNPLLFVDPDGRELRLAGDRQAEALNILAEQYRHPEQRAAIAAAANSQIKNTFAVGPIRDEPGGEVTFGENLTKLNSPRSNPDPAKTTNDITIDVDKIQASKGSVDDITRHELSHTGDINTDLKSFAKDPGASETKARKVESSPAGAPDMSLGDAKAAVQKLLTPPPMADKKKENQP